MKQEDIERYHAWVKTQPCMDCGTTPVDISHYNGMSGYYLGRGAAKRAHHLMVAPHCRECHEKVERREMWKLPVEDDFINRLSHSEAMLVHIDRTLIRAVDEGVLTVKKR